MTNGGGQKHEPKKNGKSKGRKKTVKAKTRKGWAAKAVQGQAGSN